MKNQNERRAKKVFNLIIVDESGSMSVIREQAFTGMNETLKTIQNIQKKYSDTAKTSGATPAAPAPFASNTGKKASNSSSAETTTTSNKDCPTSTPSPSPSSPTATPHSSNSSKATSTS